MKYTVSKKLGGLIGGLAAVFLLASLFSYISMDQIIKSFDRVSDVTTKKIQAAMEAKVQLQYAVHEYKNYLLRKKEKYRQAWYKHVKELREALDKYEQYAKHEVEKKMIEKAKAQLADYSQSMPLLVKAMESITSVKELDRAVKGVDRPLMETLERLNADAMNDYIEEIHTIDKNSAKIKTMVLIIALFAIILSSLLAYYFIKKIVRAIKEIQIGIDNVSKGDLSYKIKRLSNDELGEIADDFNTMTDRLKDVITSINKSSLMITQSAEQTSKATAHIYSGMEDQTNQIEQVAAASTEISQTIMNVAENANNASTAAKDALKAAEDGRVIVEKTASSLSEISESVEELANTINILGESSKNIGEIVNVIDEIAEQTNLLALNAAIEAARAGEKGKGFAVVADEVRKLAERTSKATEEISGMISKIQKDAEASVEQMQRGKAKAEEGVKFSEEVKNSIKRIIKASQDCYDMIQSIATAMEEQSSAIEQITNNLENISSISVSSKDEIEKINKSTKELERLATELSRLVEWFKIEQREFTNTIKDTFSTPTQPEEEVFIAQTPNQVSGNGEKNVI